MPRNKKLINLKEALLDRVSNDYKVEISAIMGGCRESELVDLRCIIASILLKAGCSKSAIGRFLNRDHSTVFNLVKRIENRPDLQMMAKSYVKFFKKYF